MRGVQVVEFSLLSATNDKVSGVFGAFDCLVEASGDSNELSKATFLDFVREFSRSPRTRPIRMRTANIMFATVDRQNKRRIGKREFCEVCAVMQYEFWTTTKYSWIKEVWPQLWKRPALSAIRTRVEDGRFETLMNYVLTLNLILVASESVYDLYGQGGQLQVLSYCEVLFSLLYVGEVVTKLTVYSWSEYISEANNKFDFVTTMLLLGSSTAEVVFDSQAAKSCDLKKYMNVLRLLRLLRVLKRLKNLDAVQFMIETITRLVSASKEMISFMGVVVFFYTMLGVQMFGGVMVEGFNVPGTKGLVESEYAENNYWALNFNDVPMAFGVWVIMLLCEYVPILPDAIYNTSPIPGAWLVFPTFYLIGVSIVFELVMAFTIEVFVDLYGKRDDDDEFVSLETIKKDIEHRGLGLHYRIVGSERAAEMARDAVEERLTEMEEQDLLETKYKNLAQSIDR